MTQVSRGYKTQLSSRPFYIQNEVAKTPQLKMALQFLYQLLPVLLLLTTMHVSANYLRTMRFDGMRKPVRTEQSDLSPEFFIKYYRQTLDHFNYRRESYATFQQRYIINCKYWGGPNTGEEALVTYDVPDGFIVDLAS